MRPSLDIEIERRAWARLVAAHIGATLAAQGQSATLARYAEEDIKSAEQALRDLGVDAHALILEAINASTTAGLVNLTVDDVLRAQRKLQENNVPPPYELRATENALRCLLATFEGDRVVEHPEDDQPVLNPGEKWLGRIYFTHLIAVPELRKRA
jgi:hypothetical protein